MNPSPRYRVLWTETALEMLDAVGDRRIQQQLFDASKRLEAEPDKQGKPLHEELLGFRSLRVVGQRYRVIYSFDTPPGTVYVVAAGARARVTTFIAWPRSWFVSASRLRRGRGSPPGAAHAGEKRNDSLSQQ